MIKAIIINDSRDETLRVLDAILGDRKTWFEYSPSETAHQLGLPESTVRYNVRKLVKLGYLRVDGRGYSPTERVQYLQEKAKG